MFKLFPKTDKQKTGYLVFWPDNPDGSIQFFFHGIGQIGDGTLTALVSVRDDLINHSWPVGDWIMQMTKRGTTAIFPNLLNTDANWDLGYVDDALKFAEQFSYDKTKMHLAGHSLGGQLVWGYPGSTPERGKMFASIIAIAPVDIQTNFANIKTPVRIYVSQNDGLYQEAKSAWNKINATNPPVKAELIPTGSDHNICGLVFDNEETWKWMLSKTSNGTIQVPDVPAPTPAPSPFKADASATLTSVAGTTAVLDGSKSIFKNKWNVSWELISAPAGVWNVFPRVNGNVSKIGDVITITGLVPGVYVFQESVSDDMGSVKSTDRVTLSVSAISGKQSISEVTIGGKAAIMYADFTWAYK